MQLNTIDLQENIERAIGALLTYCIRQGWSGHDPYDALNSSIIQHLPFARSKVFRLAATQVLKRSPINFRGLLRVPKTENPKGCALTCTALVRLYSGGYLKEKTLVRERVDRLLDLRTKKHRFYCWGYSFDWQGRNRLIPKFEPNIICTTFAGNALLDAYEVFGDMKLVEAAISAGDFLVSGLNISSSDGGICFSYTPLDQIQVHNANLLGAAYLARLYAFSGDKKSLQLAEKAVHFSLERQKSNGSWLYGEEKSQNWIDNFHTGFNLVALWRISRILSDRRIQESLKRGLDYYIENFFLSNGVPKYFNNRIWPIDIHSVAQSLVTLCELSGLHENALTVARKVCSWALERMRNEKGYFYYQIGRYYRNRIEYMRWSQAWMLYALSVMLMQMKSEKAPSDEKALHD